MSSTDGRDDDLRIETFERVEFLLFDSLVHHLIEKGVLTRNDALSVVQTAAEVVRGRLDGDAMDAQAKKALATLERTYSSFEALRERQGAAPPYGHNVHQMRVPIDRDRPRFPSETDG